MKERSDLYRIKPIIMNKRVHVFYSGTVQGVGFRYTVREIAHELAVLGWVKNLRDGRVEVVAEAAEDVLAHFLGRIRAGFSHYVKNAAVEWLEATGEFEKFGVAF
jgi:acylphosphatase